MGCSGLLVRSFPGATVKVDHSRIRSRVFQRQLGSCIVQLDSETLEKAMPTTEKGAPKPEDTNHPRFVTEFLMGILRSVGSSFDCGRFQKNTRDDIVIKDGHLPWRRSPLALLIKVCLQLLTRESDIAEKQSSGPDLLYKSFMVFFIGRLLERAMEENAEIESEILHVMLSKLSRRVKKIEGHLDEKLLKHLENISKRAKKCLVERWQALEFRRTRSWKLDDSLFEEHTKQTLEDLAPVLAMTMSSRLETSGQSVFSANERRRIAMNREVFPDIQILEESPNGDVVALRDIELWVRRHLDTWFDAQEPREAWVQVSDLLDIYRIHLNAPKAYEGSPEDLSIMMLTFLHLWTVLDTCAASEHEILRQFDPGFYVEMLEPLCLPKRHHYTQLARITAYIESRRQGALDGMPSPFSSKIQANSLTVVYYNSSNTCIELRRSILQDAQRLKDEKIQEYNRLTQKHEQLAQTLATMNCDYVKRNRDDIERSHSNACRRCAVKREMDCLGIVKYEWPLPKGENEIKAVVAELTLPSLLSEWRDHTYSLLVDVFSPQFKEQKMSASNLLYLLRYEPLRKYITAEPGRVQLVSHAKQGAYGSRKPLHILNVTADTVVTNPGFSFFGLDSHLMHRTESLINRCDILAQCTFILPEHPQLKRYVEGTSHTSNEVIAQQSRCPAQMTLHEFYSFASLRSGHRIQWRNIARILHAKSLNFASKDVYTLILQAALQTSVQDDFENPVPEAHRDLKDERFGEELLVTVEGCIKSIEGNWRGVTAMHTFIVIICRLLTFTQNETISKQCLLLLRKAREIAFGWINSIRSSLQETSQNKVVIELRRWLLDAALVCYLTYDVEPRHFDSVLEPESDDISIIVESAIIISDSVPADMRKLHPTIRILLRRQSRLAQQIEPYLRRSITDNRSKMDDAIKRIWNSFSPSAAEWKAVDAPNERWIYTTTDSADGARRTVVSYDLLSGSLLVNGTPLSRLPRKYESHDLYRRLFKTVRMQFSF